MRYMKNECLCMHCTATVDEAQWSFGLFCEFDTIEDCSIVAAPTLRLGDLRLFDEDAGQLAAVASATISGGQPELNLECSQSSDDTPGGDNTDNTP